MLRIPSDSVGFHGFHGVLWIPWDSMGFRGFRGVIVAGGIGASAVLEFLRIPQDSCGLRRIPQEYVGNGKVLAFSFTRCSSCWVFSFTGCSTCWAFSFSRCSNCCVCNWVVPTNLIIKTG